ncbi:MAG: hypothetical protein R2716_06395 [Microthrixaceae bacterium]
MEALGLAPSSMKVRSSGRPKFSGVRVQSTRLTAYSMTLRSTKTSSLRRCSAWISPRVITSDAVGGVVPMRWTISISSPGAG